MRLRQELHGNKKYEDDASGLQFLKGHPLRCSPENAHGELSKEVDVCVNMFVCVLLQKSSTLEILVAHREMHFKFQPTRFMYTQCQSPRSCSHRGLRPWSVVGKSSPRESQPVGAERAEICPSPFRQVGQQFLGKGLRPTERQHLHGAEVEVRGVRARAFVGSARGQWSRLGHATLRQLFMILQRDGRSAIMT